MFSWLKEVSFDRRYGLCYINYIFDCQKEVSKLSKDSQEHACGQTKSGLFSRPQQVKTAHREPWGILVMGI